MAALGPAPAMLSKERSSSMPVSLRNCRSLSATDHSVRLPLGAAASNQQRKRDMATPSRLWAARAPSCSVLFFFALGKTQRSVALMIFALTSVDLIFSGAQLLSI